MAKLPSQFNDEESQKYGEMNDYTPIKGEVIAKIVESDYLQNSKKTGHYLKLVREIVWPEQYKGRKLFSNLNLDNPNAVAVEIAHKEWNSTKKACGKVVVEDSEEIHGIEHKLVLSIKKGKGDEPDEQRIDKILPLDGAAKPSSAPKAGGGKSDAAKPEKPAKRRRPIFEDDEDEDEDDEE